MNIHPRPDQELAIQEAIRAGLISTNIEALDIGLQSLRNRLMERLEKSGANKLKKNNLIDIFSKVRGDDLDFTRNQATGRLVDL